MPEKSTLAIILGVCMLLILFWGGKQTNRSVVAEVWWFLCFWGTEFILAAMIVYLMLPGMVK